MIVEIPDTKIMKEAFDIVNEVYSPQELEALIMKLLRKYKQHNDFGNGGWYTINEYVSKQYKKEKDYGEMSSM